MLPIPKLHPLTIAWASGMTDADMKLVVTTGDLIEEDPKAHPFPKGLLIPVGSCYDIRTNMNTRFTRRAVMRAIGAGAIPLTAQTAQTPVATKGAIPKDQGMELGAFSISLAVKDLEASRKFYEKFGFRPMAGGASKHYLILKNGDHVIGLFQGMFEKNILTFNPGWDSSAQKLAKFTDVRELQRQLKAQGVKMMNEADESTTGPASFIVLTRTETRFSSISTSKLEAVSGLPGWDTVS